MAYSLSLSPRTDSGRKSSTTSMISHSLIHTLENLTRLNCPSVEIVERHQPSAASVLGLHQAGVLQQPDDAASQQKSSLSETGELWSLLAHYEPSAEDKSIRVVVYPSLLRSCAQQLKIEETTLQEIALVHALTQGLLHLGSPTNDSVYTSQHWENYTEAPQKVREFFSLLFTNFLFEGLGLEEHLAIMRKWADFESPVYNRWQDFLEESVGLMRWSLNGTRGGSEKGEIKFDLQQTCFSKG